MMKRTRSEHVYDILQRLFQELDQDAIRRDVDQLRESRPLDTPAELVRIITKKTALKTAAVGAASSAATGPLAFLTMAPDIFNLVRQQSRLILSIAFIYGQKPNLPQRFKEVLAVLALSTGASFARRGVTVLLERGFEEKIARKLAVKIAGSLIGKRLPKVIPVVGGLVGGTLNYMAVRAVSKVAEEFYQSRDESEAEGL
ncbi:MAG TPA: EcsC family protein [Thermoanaerobaculia bacterium]|nr:EcsC family protein [Thermoanaerobaculia bacterium]